MTIKPLAFHCQVRRWMWTSFESNKRQQRLSWKVRAGSWGPSGPTLDKSFFPVPPLTQNSLPYNLWFWPSVWRPNDLPRQFSGRQRGWGESHPRDNKIPCLCHAWMSELNVLPAHWEAQVETPKIKLAHDDGNCRVQAEINTKLPWRNIFTIQWS